MEESIKVEFNSNEVSITAKGLFTIEFVEDGVHFVYAPAFDITGYGASEKEASESFKIQLSEFFSYSLTNKTLFNELERLGWTIENKVASKRMATPPTFNSLLHRNDDFSKIISDKNFHKQQLDLAIA